MPRELLTMQNNYEWEAIEGQTLGIENAIRSNAKDLKIEGKTFNNIYKMENIKFTGIGTGGLQELKSDGYFYLNKIASDMYCDITQDLTLPITSNTTYTLVVDIRTNTLTGSMDFNAEYMDRSWFLESAPLPAGTTGRKMYKLTSKSVLPMHESARPLRTQLSPSVEGILEYKVILLEGDYTNSYAPSNINGIESVAEREKEGNLYPIKIAQSHNETDGITLPNGVKNTIEMVDGVLNHIQRVGKYTANDTRFITTPEVTCETSVMFKIDAKSEYSWLKPKNYVNTKSHPICSLFNYIPSEKPVDELYVSESDDACFYAGGSDWLRVKLTKATYGKIISLTEFLEMNPIIYYELITPVYTPIEEVTNIDLPQPLRSLPNGVCDTIENGKVIQRVGKIVLDETKTYIKQTISGAKITQRFNVEITDMKIGANNSCCDKFVLKNNDSDTIHYKLGGAIYKAFFYIPINYNTNDLAKQYFSENPTTLYYELETPIEHTINVPRVPIAKGSNIITTTNNIKPNLSMKYKRKK